MRTRRKKWKKREGVKANGKTTEQWKQIQNEANKMRRMLRSSKGK